MYIIIITNQWDWYPKCVVHFFLIKAAYIARSQTLPLLEITILDIVHKKKLDGGSRWYLVRLYAFDERK